MFSAINEIQEIKQNRFENIPLVKHIDEVKQAEITGNQSLSAYVSDISGVLHDDGGAIYCRHGKLIPNLSYALNGYRYMTDGKGRIVTCEAKPKITPENLRDFGAQRQVGDIYRRPNDQGGHIISRDLNGFGGLGNLVAMDSKINQSDYKRMENEIKSLLNNNANVYMKTDISYSADSLRPDSITASVRSERVNNVYKFDNNINGYLRKEILKNKSEVVDNILRSTRGEITSIKDVYDNTGKLCKKTYYITYQDANGKNYRRSVVVDNI